LVGQNGITGICRFGEFAIVKQNDMVEEIAQPDATVDRQGQTEMDWRRRFS
jgi:hypothetical protein